MTEKHVDLTGQTFGRLTAIRAHPVRSKDGCVRWECSCTCGAEVVVTSRRLRNKDTASCGCYRRDRGARMLTERNSRDVVTYKGAHTRVKRAKGSASEHSCIDCGEQAVDWSYRHDDPEELLGMKGKYLLAYSQKPEHYDPRCRQCHFEVDLTRDDRGTFVSKRVAR